MPSSHQPPSRGYLPPPPYAGAYTNVPDVGFGQAHGLCYLTSGYVQPYASEFVFREASLSPLVKRFKVTDAATGHVAFVVKRVSWRCSTLICNAKDVVLYRRFRRGFVGSRGRRVRDAYGYSVGAVQGDEYVVVRGGLFGVYCGLGDMELPRFRAEGDIHGGIYVIRETSTRAVVAEVTKMRRRGMGHDRICVRVTAGNNAAFLVFFAIGLGEKGREGGGAPRGLTVE